MSYMVVADLLGDVVRSFIRQSLFSSQGLLNGGGSREEVS